MLHKPDLNEHLMHNVFFDTCVYHQPGINLLFDVINLDNILFGSEMVGAVRGIDPETGHYFDDTNATWTRWTSPRRRVKQVFRRQRQTRVPAPGRHD